MLATTDGILQTGVPATLQQIDTTLEAIRLQREGRKFRMTDLAIRPFWTFAKLYVGKLGFLDGLEGFTFCALSGLSVAVWHFKHRELTRARRAS